MGAWKQHGEKTSQRFLETKQSSTPDLSTIGAKSSSLEDILSKVGGARQDAENVCIWVRFTSCATSRTRKQQTHCNGLRVV